MKARCFFFLSWIILLASCSSTKNTGGTRWYHSFNTRYNVYFNGNEAFNQAWKAQLEGHTDNYSEMILMYPVSALPKEKANTGGPFDKAIEKAVKAIKMHSIQSKPNRNQNKQRDPKYREFINRTEYNPFLHNVWMLMAKSQFYNGDFLEAASSFSYISRLYETQPEITNTAKIWKARSYTEMGWFYEADDILKKLDKTQLTKTQNNLFSAVNADHLIKQKQYAEAIPYLKNSIKSGKNKLQKTREKYLLGQIFAATGQKELAYKTFGEVSSSNAPYILELSSRIRQTEVYPGGDINKMSKKLNKMTKSVKNKEYLDKIYYALGNVYMTVPDTVKAIESYELGVEKTVNLGIDRALNQIRLGDIYFDQRKYLKAQPNYSEAMGQLKKSDEAYPRVSKRSAALDALVIHFEAVELQDSLQRLSRMTEEERMVVINKIIEDIIKKEKEAQDKAKKEELLAQQESLQGRQQSNRPSSQPSMGSMTPPGASDEFYFYNSQVVTLGKNNFQQKWGRRNLEDDWRRRNKSGVAPDMNENQAIADADNKTETNDVSQTEVVDSAQSNETKASSRDPKDPQFYLQQIPETEEDLAASDLIISAGLFNMGIIYKDMLEDNNQALETFEKLNTRFPENENKEMAYYYTYQIYWKEDKMDMANLYKAKIREEFPEGDLAIAMADPDYEYNLMRMDFIQDSLYQETYAHYIDGNSMIIRENYEWISTKYNQSKLMPKFMFLNALSYAQTNEPDTFKILLKELIDKYPSEDVAALASEMMKGFQKGLILSVSGDNMLVQGSLFKMRFGAGEGAGIVSDSIKFSPETAKPHELILFYTKESINDNLLLFTVAGFNFGNYRNKDFDLEKTAFGEIGLLRIKGFNDQEETFQYLQKIREPEGYANEWSRDVIIVPISTDNYSILTKGKSLEEYMNFFEKHFAKGNESLIALWRLKQAEEMEVSSIVKEEELMSETDEKVIEKIELQEKVSTEDSDQTTSTDKELTEPDDIDSDEIIDSVNEIYNKASDKMDAFSKTYNEAAADPIRWFLNLFKRDKRNTAIEEYAKQQEKEEKERQKQIKKEQDEKAKIAKAEAKQKEMEKNELLKKQADDEKAAAKLKQQQQKDLVNKAAFEKKQKEDEKKQQEAEKKRLAQEKKKTQEQALKQRIADQKAKEKARKEEQKRKEKEREELRKQKEKERKKK